MHSGSLYSFSISKILFWLGSWIFMEMVFGSWLLVLKFLLFDIFGNYFVFCKTFRNIQFYKFYLLLEFLFASSFDDVVNLFLILITFILLLLVWSSSWIIILFVFLIFFVFISLPHHLITSCSLPREAA